MNELFTVEWKQWDLGKQSDCKLGEFRQELGRILKMLECYMQYN